MADPLLEAIVAGDGAGVAAALRGRPEAERRALAPALLKIRQDERWVLKLDAGGVLVAGELEWTEYVLTDAALDLEYRQGGALRLALLGTASLTELRRVGAWSMSLLDDALGAEVLLDRRPQWLASWAEWILGADMFMSRWRLVRALVRAGAIERPPAARYLAGMVTAARADEHAQALLDDDPELLAHELWELIPFDGEEDSLRAADDSGDAGWAAAIAACAADGRIPRQRLLDALLDALASDLNAYRSAWHTRFWRDLGVTTDERLARTARLRTLLGAAAAPIVTFAVEELVRGGGTPPSELGPALTAPAKKTVRAALKLLDRAVAEDATLASEAAVAATAALGHEAADVQGEVLDRLERWSVPGEALLAHIDLLAATVRPRAEALLGLAGFPAVPDDAPDVDVAAIPLELRAALAFDGPVPEAPVLGEPVLGPAAQPPIATLGELADELARALTVTPWDNVDERLLDGILRHCGSRAPFDGPLKPLVGRLQNLAGIYLEPSVTEVAAAWLTETPVARPYRPGNWARRLHAASLRAARGRPAALLALPSHAGGWLAPAVLVERLRAAGEEVDEPELAQALLRLAPDGRAAALEAAAALPGRPGAIARCALGGDEHVLGGEAAYAAWAVREPPLETAPRVSIERRGERDHYPRLRGESSTWPLLPPVSELVEGAMDSGYGAPLDLRRGPFEWPARRDLACAGAILRLEANLGTYVDRAHSVENVLAPLVRAGEPLPPLALRLAALALGSGHDRDHMVAVDLLAAAIDDGRADAPGLAPGLLADLESGLLMTNRLGPRLTVLAAAGPLQRAVVRDLLDATVHALAALPSRTHAALLVPFDELCAQTDTRVRDERTRAFLASLAGSSKAAKAAQSLLERDGDPPEAERALALAARVRRAQRWLSA